MSVQRRLERLERLLVSHEAAEGCPHPCHQQGGPEVDYRQSAAILSADPEAAAQAYRAQFCPDCGEPARGIAVRAVDLGHHAYGHIPRSNPAPKEGETA